MAVVAIAALIAAIIAIHRRGRSLRLRQHFGREYDLAVLDRGDRGKAETALINREKRTPSFTIKTLSPTARDRFAEDWALIQSRFVDEPAIAVNEADSLVIRVMAARGYPAADFEQRAADVSVAYPAIVQNYRAARINLQRYGRSEGRTEELRQAMVHYRSLLDELLGASTFGTAKTGVLYERAS
ncbi:MAG: hypothetical protein ABSB60_12520 [Terracidiphilus sp.]